MHFLRGIKYYSYCFLSLLGVEIMHIIIFRATTQKLRFFLFFYKNVCAQFCVNLGAIMGENLMKMGIRTAIKLTMVSPC